MINISYLVCEANDPSEKLNPILKLSISNRLIMIHRDSSLCEGCRTSKNNIFERRIMEAVFWFTPTTFHTFSYRFIPFHTVSHRFTPFHTVSYLLVPFHTVSYLLTKRYETVWNGTSTVSYRFIPFHKVSYRFIPFHTVSYRFISFHPVSYRFIPFHTVS